MLVLFVVFVLLFIVFVLGPLTFRKTWPLLTGLRLVVFVVFVGGVVPFAIRGKGGCDGGDWSVFEFCGGGVVVVDIFC